MKKIITKSCELIDPRRVKVRGWGATTSFQIALRREAYSPDRLYAWRGRHTSPSQEWMQNSTETENEFVKRVKEELAANL